MTTRRQHYVWRHYLRAWSTNDHIWCLRNGKKFSSNLINVGQERDFYAVNDISDNDIRYIMDVSKKRHAGVLNESNKDFVEFYRSVSMLRSKAHEDNEIKNQLIQFEEKLMSSIEADGIEYMKLLSDGEVEFFYEEAHRAKFSHFLMIQFVRTKRMSETIKAGMRDYLARIQVNVDNVWPVEKYIDAGHMALSLYADKEFRISLIRNESDAEFITGDQPILNIHGIGSGNSVPANTSFYSPISPRLAFILSKDEYPSIAASQDVARYNSFIREMSLEQIYASTEASL